MFQKGLLATGIITLGILLGGCDGSDKQSSPNAQSSSGTQNSVSAEQAGIEKYNAYVEVANRGADFDELLDRHQSYYGRDIASGNKLTSYSIFNRYDIISLQKLLTTALALPSPMPELDTPAQGMLAALNKLAPIHTELDDYANAKGYLADDGKKAREMEGAFVTAMKEVAEQQVIFFDGISKRDDINVKAAFENAESGSSEYYRAGIILYAKESVGLAVDFFESAGSEQTTKPFEQSLNKTASMIESWGKSTAGQKSLSRCSMMRGNLNQFVGKGREAINSARSGKYLREGHSELKWKISNPIEFDAKSFQRAFDTLINDMNKHDCA